jgi:RimJ/RimL family protein N-acetyltransferase
MCFQLLSYGSVQASTPDRRFGHNYTANTRTQCEIIHAYCVYHVWKTTSIGLTIVTQTLRTSTYDGTTRWRASLVICLQLGESWWMVRTAPISRSRPASRIEIEFQGEHYVLRPFVMSDVERVHTLVWNSRAQLRQYQPWILDQTSKKVCIRRVKKQMIDYFAGKSFTMGLFSKDEKKFFGTSYLDRVEKNEHCLDLAGWAVAPRANKGAATIGAQMLIIYAFEFLNCNRIQAHHDLDNIPSRRVLEKCGFQPEGIMRNWSKPMDVPNPEDLLEEVPQPSGAAQLHGLIPEDIPSLTWYPQVRDQIVFYDLFGEPVELP